MQKVLYLFLFSIILINFSFAIDPVEGYWKSMEKDKPSGFWMLYVENNLLYGRCLLAVGKYIDTTLSKCTKDYPNYPLKENITSYKRMDLPLIYNLEYIENGVWGNGYIINAGNGRFYTCNISFCKADNKKFLVDSIAVRGEVGLGIGKTIYWEKSSIEEINIAIKKNIKEMGTEYMKQNIETYLLK